MIPVPLQPHATDLAEFADDLARLGPMTAKSLSEQYLDQNLADGWEESFPSFDAAVEAFIPQVEYYV